MKKKVIGTTEDRLNRFMSMCLEWQRDLRNFIYHPAAYYFTNYHLGKVKKELIGDLRNVVIDREWAIDRMNGISLTRAENEVKSGFKANNRTIYSENNRKTRQLDLFADNDKNGKLDKKAVELINVMLERGYKVTLERTV